MSQLLSLKKSDITALSLFFQALANNTRIGILNLLRKGPRSVGEISQSLGLEQTVVSHNLKCLSFCGLVFGQQMGKMRIYSINEEVVEPILRLGDRHVSIYASNLRHCKSLER